MLKLKGLKQGVLRCVIPEDLSERKLLEEFERLTRDGANILSGSGLEIDTGERKYTPALVLKIWKCFIEPSGCHVVSWRSADEDTIHVLSSLGLRVSEAEGTQKTAQECGNKPASGLFFAGNVRGGQRIEHDGDVIIAGHVHDSAEVIASGHIVVLGRLRGVLHAGSGGDESASVSVRSLETGQIRIGNRVGIIERTSEFWGKPAIITVRETEVLLAGWPAIQI